MRIIAYLLILIIAIMMCIVIGSCSPPNTRNGLRPLPWNTPTRLVESNPPITEGWELIGEKDNCKVYARYYAQDGHGAFVFWSICNDQVNSQTSISAK